MTNKERCIRCALKQPIDRAPFFFYFGPWGETMTEWKKQGISDSNAWKSDEFGFDTGILDITEHINLSFYPYFEEKIISENGDIVLDLGEICKYNEYYAKKCMFCRGGKG